MTDGFVVDGDFSLEEWEVESDGLVVDGDFSLEEWEVESPRRSWAATWR